MTSIARYLWTASRNRVVVTPAEPPEIVSSGLAAALAQSDEFLGKVANNGVKIWRSRRYAHSRNTFAPILYAVIVPTPNGSRLDGHFQLNPVMRLFLILWFVGTTALALAVLGTGLLSATPESNAADALPYLFPTILPLLGWVILRWQQRRGRADEEAIHEWVGTVLGTLER